MEQKKYHRPYGDAFGEAVHLLIKELGIKSPRRLWEIAGLGTNRNQWYDRVNGKAQTRKEDLETLFWGLEEQGYHLTPNIRKALEASIGVIRVPDRPDRITQLRTALDPDRDDLLKRRLDEFVDGTRQQEIRDILKQIERLKETGGYLAITGRAGEGKTSLVAQLIATHFQQDRGAYHIIPFMPTLDHQVTLLRSLMASLALKYTYLPDDWLSMYHRDTLVGIFVRMLKQIAEKGDQEVLFIDGLDQIQSEGPSGERDLNFLPLVVPQGIVMVLSTRPDDTLQPLELRSPLHHYELPNLSRNDASSIFMRYTAHLSKQVIDQLYGAAQGNALYVHLLARELEKNEKLSVQEIVQCVSNNPNRIYAFAIDHLKHPKAVWKQVLRPLLGVFLAAQEPLGLDAIRHILCIEKEEVREGIQRLGGLVEQSGRGKYYLYHLKFRDYLRGDTFAEEAVISVEEEQLRHEQLALWCAGEDPNGGTVIWQKTNNPLEQERRKYAQRFYVVHLYYAHLWERLFVVLDTGDFGHAKILDDPSMRSYALDLAWGERAAAREGWSLEQGINYLPSLWHYGLLRCRLTGRADSYPDEAFQTLLHLQQITKALGLIELLTDPIRKIRMFLLIANTLATQRDQQQDGKQFIKRAATVVSLMEHSFERDHALEVLVSNLAEVREWQEAEQVIATIQGSDREFQLLSVLASSLVQAQEWQEAERVIATIQDSGWQAKALSMLASNLAEEHKWQEAERVITTIQNSGWQAMLVKAETLSRLVSSLIQAQQWQEVERVIAIMWTSEMKADALSALASNLAQAGKHESAERIWQEVERIIVTIQDSDRQTRALIELASSLAQASKCESAEQVWQEAERGIVTIQDNDRQTKGLSRLASSLTKGHQWQEAERVIATIQDRVTQTEALNGLVNSLVEARQWQEAERVIATIQDRVTQAKALNGLVNNLVEAQEWQEAERVIATIQDGEWQAELLSGLVGGLVKTQEWQEAERVIATILRGESEAKVAKEKALSGLAGSLVEVQEWQEAERIIATIQDNATRSEALSGLASALVEAQEWREAQRIIATIQDNDRQVKLLSGLVSSLAQTGQCELAEQVWWDVERAIALTQDSNWQTRVARAEALSGLAGSLAEAQEWQEAERIIATIQDNPLKAEAARRLAGSLIEGLEWQEAQRVIATIEERAWQVKLLSRLANGLAQAQEWQEAEKVWQETEKIIALIWDSEEEAESLRVLASSLFQAGKYEPAERLWQEVERVIATIEDTVVCWNVGPSKQRPGSVHQNYYGLNFSEYRGRERRAERKGEILSALASNLFQAGKREAAKRVWQEAKRVIAIIEEREWQAKDEAVPMALSELASSLDHTLRVLASSLAQTQQWQEAERVIAALQGSDREPKALSELASSLAQAKEWQEAKRIIATIQDSATQAEALNVFASSLAKAGRREAAELVWQEVEQAVAATQNWQANRKAEALSVLASSLFQAGKRESAERVWQEARQVITTIQDREWQAKVEALSVLASSLAQTQQWQALLEVIQHFWKLTKAETEILSLLPLAFNFLAFVPQLGKGLHDAFVQAETFLCDSV